MAKEQLLGNTKMRQRSLRTLETPIHLSLREGLYCNATICSTIWYTCYQLDRKNNNVELNPIVRLIKMLLILLITLGSLACEFDTEVSCISLWLRRSSRDILCVKKYRRDQHGGVQYSLVFSPFSTTASLPKVPDLSLKVPKMYAQFRMIMTSTFTYAVLLFQL